MENSPNKGGQICSVKCSPCVFNGRNVDAIKWCNTCPEGLCKDCILNHVTGRNHPLISIEQYIATISLKLDIQTICKEHGKKLDFFCPVHENTACTPCLSEKHHKCENVVRIEDVAKNYRGSQQLSDLDEGIHEAKRNIENVLRYQLQNKKSLVNCKSAIQKNISTIRSDINEYLDNLETKLLQELENTYKTCTSEINTFMMQLQKDVQSINSLMVTTKEVKNMASDIHCFLGARDLARRFQPIERRMDITMNELEAYEICISYDDTLVSLKGKLTTIGKIKVEKTPMPIKIQNFKYRQAQIPLPVNKAKNYNDMLMLKEKIPILPSETNQLITSCLILPNDKFLFIHRNIHKLFMQNKFGNIISSCDISGSPYDVDVIDDKNVVVSYGALAYIEIVNLIHDKGTRRTPVGGYCSGVCFDSETGRVYAVVRNKGIIVTSLVGNIHAFVKKCNTDTGYISVSKNRLVYSDTKNKSIHCLDVSGVEIWNFRFDTCKLLRGVQIDATGNVLVADSESSQLILVFPEGGDSRVVLDNRSNLCRPFGLHLHKCKNQLLICNSIDGNAFLYKIK